MKLDQLVPGAPSIEITGITADSRKVKPGFLFAALQGVAKDGRDYIDGAIKMGAVAVLTDNRPGEWSVPAVKSVEARLALATAAAAFYSQQPATVAAVTGTNGKSTTALLVANWRSATLQVCGDLVRSVASSFIAQSLSSASKLANMSS